MELSTKPDAAPLIETHERPPSTLRSKMVFPARLLPTAKHTEPPGHEIPSRIDPSDVADCTVHAPNTNTDTNTVNTRPNRNAMRISRPNQYATTTQAS